MRSLFGYLCSAEYLNHDKEIMEALEQREEGMRVVKRHRSLSTEDTQAITNEEMQHYASEKLKSSSNRADGSRECSIFFAPVVPVTTVSKASSYASNPPPDVSTIDDTTLATQPKIDTPKTILALPLVSAPKVCRVHFLILALALVYLSTKPSITYAPIISSVSHPRLEAQVRPPHIQHNSRICRLVYSAVLG
ncbi:hypothetical protein K432DRAFT_421696 [Lepidopterella palustris CBS 459.81]|uniref:Uncharacterized protein n=1 Tax=Lepidopterella palustris CBS 459.81 TaxID=1314670 RepID=A0A8E2EKD5_9PEZI|nr:hypothetical protein K432DRAFT_421696 [Lepidopterella palustris CBS 459.81]